jgi:hypothetical protein
MPPKSPKGKKKKKAAAEKKADDFLVPVREGPA